MTVEQIKSFYENKMNTPCELTEKLIKMGYQQKRGEYIKRAKEVGLLVDYTVAEPNQWWHLIKSWCEYSKPGHKFTRSIRCGELYFWMAEVSGVFTKKELEDILNKALTIAKNNTPNNKKPLRTVESNLFIRDCCFERIKNAVETNCIIKK